MSRAASPTTSSLSEATTAIRTAARFCWLRNRKLVYCTMGLIVSRALCDAARLRGADVEVIFNAASLATILMFMERNQLFHMSRAIWRSTASHWKVSRDVALISCHASFNFGRSGVVVVATTASASLCVLTASPPWLLSQFSPTTPPASPRRKKVQ